MIIKSEEKGIILRVEDLSCSINKMPVLNNVDLKIKQGEITALFGDSGTGKTTLLKILSLLFREEPAYEVKGKVFFGNNGEEDILAVKEDLWRIRRKIVYISQVPNPLQMSIMKNVEFPLILQGAKDKVLLKDKAVSALKAVHLYDEVKDRLNSSATGLSGGQKQKLCIARALTLDPEVILLDEPTSSLDTTNKLLIEDLIKELGSNYSMIVVSHDREQIKRTADSCYECRDGKILISKI